MTRRTARSFFPISFNLADAVLGGALAMLFVYLLVPSAASAARGHVLGPQTIGAKCTNEPCAPGTLKEPAGLAVNEATGVLYIVDRALHRVERFDASTGAYLGSFDGGASYEKEPGVTEPTVEAGHGAIGFPEEVESGVFEEPEAIAVDNSCHLHSPPLTEATTPKCSEFDPSYGDVYVVDPQGHLQPATEHRPVVDKFSPSGAYLGQITRNVTGEPFSDLGFKELYGVAVDSTGQVWVYSQNFGTGFREQVTNYSNAEPNLRISSRLASGDRPPFAVDSADNLYVGFAPFDEITHIAKYTSVGGVNPQEHEFGQPPATAVATEPTTDDVYIDNETAWRRYTPEERELESQPIPGGHGTGIAVDATSTPGTSTVYVADSAADVIHVYPPEPPGPPTVEVGSTSVSDVTSSSALLRAEVNPRSEPGEEATHYRFEYGACPTVLTCPSTFEATVPVPAGELEANYEPDPVTAALTGLAPATVYHFRLSAENSLSVEPTLGEERTFTTQASGATGLPDHRAYELVSPAQKLGAILAPIGGGGSGLIQASASGDAVSYYANAPTEANPAGFTQSVQLLSRRAGPGSSPWLTTNIATPHASAAGVSLNTNGEYLFFTPDLSGAVAQPQGPATPLSPEATERTAYLRADFPPGDPSHPCASSCYQPLVTESNVFEAVKFGEEGTCDELCGPRFRGASPDASHVVLASGIKLTEDAEGSSGGNRSLYEWSAGRLSLLSVDEAGAPVSPEAEPRLGFGTKSHGAIARHAISTDGSRVVFSEAKGANHLFLRDNATEAQSEFEDGSAIGKGNLSAGSSTITGVSTTFGAFAVGQSIAGDGIPSGATIVSLAGSTLTLSAPATKAGSGVALEATSPCIESEKACTLRLDKIQGGDGAGKVEPVFQDASADGSRIFFTDPQQLLPGASTSGADLYECEILEGEGVLECDLHDLTPQGSGEAAGVLNVLPGASEDGASVYFVADGALTSEPSPSGEEALAGDCKGSTNGSTEAETAPERCNLYLRRNGQTRLVAVLSGADSPDWAGVTSAFSGLTDRVSPDGRYLAFTSHAALTADDTSASAARQVFRYDAGTEVLMRVSIGEQGFDDNGNRSTVTPCASFEGAFRCAEDANIVDPYIYGNWSRYRRDPTMSDNGAEVFFTSSLALTPGALDDSPIGSGTGDPSHPQYAQNVYEWEEEGTEVDGSVVCEQPAGCVRLISDGRDTGTDSGQAELCQASTSTVCLLGVDASGDNAFFSTADALTPSDTDTALDYYDARINGGFAEVQTMPCETSEACHTNTTEPRSQQAPATPGFSGKEEGPKSPEVCKKGLVRKGAKCVKPSKHNARHRKHKKGKHGASQKQPGSKHGGHK